MKRRQFLEKMACLSSVVPLTLGIKSGAAKTATRPSVLFIMTDTQRLDDMGAYGNSVINTPNLDRLAHTGTKFTRCYTQYPACMPARATVFTGRYPMAHGVWSNGVPLPESETTMAHVFAENGYRTGGAGKFHFLPHYPYRENTLPTMATHKKPFYGFQEFHLGEDGRSGEHRQWLERNYPEHAGKPDHKIPPELHNTFWSADHTIRFMTDCAEKGQPFFAFCSFVDPHQGYGPPSPYSDMYAEKDMPPPVRKPGELENSRFYDTAFGPRMSKYTKNLAHNRAQHYGEMTFIDDAVGRLVETLEKLDIQNNTLVVFVSDHGDMLGDHWLWWKGHFHYQGCTNVPLFFNWPGRIQNNKTLDILVEQVDILPTVCELAGLPVPPGVQGLSLAEKLTTNDTSPVRAFAYMASVDSGEFHPDYFDQNGKANIKKRKNAVDTYTIRNQKWRFTFYTNGRGGELYDLEDDPDEFVNLWEDPESRDIKFELLQKLTDRIAKTRDPLPLRTRPY